MTTKQIAEMINSSDEGYRARAWDKDEYHRVYVTRMLSRGRKQEMGYIEVDDETGERNYNPINRQKASIRKIVEGE